MAKQNLTIEVITRVLKYFRYIARVRKMKILFVQVKVGEKGGRENFSTRWIDAI